MRKPLSVSLPSLAMIPKAKEDKNNTKQMSDQVELQTYVLIELKIKICRNKYSRILKLKCRLGTRLHIFDKTLIKLIGFLSV